jgi:hypothetical protein
MYPRLSSSSPSSISLMSPLKPLSSSSRPSLQVHLIFFVLSSTTLVVRPSQISLSIRASISPVIPVFPSFAVRSLHSTSCSIPFPSCSRAFISVPLFHFIVYRFALVFPLVLFLRLLLSIVSPCFHHPSSCLPSLCPTPLLPTSPVQPRMQV